MDSEIMLGLACLKSHTSIMQLSMEQKLIKIASFATTPTADINRHPTAAAGPSHNNFSVLRALTTASATATATANTKVQLLSFERRL